MLCVGVTEIMQVVCIIVLECKSVLNVLPVSYALENKIMQAV